MGPIKVTVVTCDVEEKPDPRMTEFDIVVQVPDDLAARGQPWHVRLRSERGEPLRLMHFCHGTSAEVVRGMFVPGAQLQMTLGPVPAVYRGDGFCLTDRSINPRNITAVPPPFMLPEQRPIQSATTQR